MAVHAILPQRVQPTALRPLAALFTSIHAADPGFARALQRALEYVEAGAAYEPYNSTHYRIESATRLGVWHYATLDQCSCEARAAWCWHRALLHLLTAHAALLDLQRCPRPQFAHIPPRDYAAVLRDCDELF